MEFLAPSTWADALAARSEHPGAVPIAGGTDVMVELNFDRHRPDVLLDLTRVPELARVVAQRRRRHPAGRRRHLRPGDDRAGRARLPGLAMASRTVGSPQIRVRGTVGGNLGSASPAGDAHPVLLAIDAVVEVESVRGVRQVPVADFFTGVKKNALEPDELISAVLLPPPAGPQQFAKIGTRNAMVIAVTSFGLALHPQRQAVGAGDRLGRPDAAARADRRGVPRRGAGRGRPVGLAGRATRRRRDAVRRPGRGRGVADRRRARHRGVPAARPVGAGPAHAGLGLARLPARGGLSMRVELTVNGERRQADDVWEGESLLYLLRERLGLPGSKNACEQGECGSCSVYLDGEVVCACLVAAGQAEGRDVVTVEGLADDDGRLHPVQQAFLETGAVQCGFCTPGLVVAVHDLLRAGAGPGRRHEIREALAGNLCRCTGYEKILDAVRLAADRMRA